ncbi:flagellar biosynthesis protein FlhA [Acidihalobacter ferrooxydans]|uniref:Flagellar biosynthesis protein FlhA n=1 Tax=Acidihalobacter ferrooxydans TaxID=1765967 RepID=A0A1P8UGP8_9GAMM|nr:flagellar biosynthesis protein FlhA [Acidihalobacter ferrooxydans]APZ43023.1 flagellar biosynthesis protein FlhA [Acidihalobacter ferrooxydans]
MAASEAGVLGSVRSLAAMGLGVPVVLLAMLAMITLPLPPFALDVLFTFNIALSMVIALMTVYARRPLDFSIFPTVLLVATLLRLALNVASTRVVLLNGYTGTAAAGHVIQAFGDFVIGGDYAVGLVVFTILVIVNVIVVTKGAGRVSEVSARFTLDAMPGKQMAIDADLNAGIITQEEARLRREEVTQEADFYGAMDGASKFVRGDAVAGILILFVNIIGGLVIGMTQHGMTFQDATHNYVLLTIGDGLVAQIPSLLLATSTAIIVTRVSSSQDMGQQIVQQLFGSARALFITAGIIGLLGLIPGMPSIFLGLGALLAGTAYWMLRRQQAAAAAEAETSAEPEQTRQRELSWEDVEPVDIVELEVGYRLIPLVDSNQGGVLMTRIKGVRRKLSQELGFLIPPVHIRDNLELAPNAYRISLNGVPIGEAEVYPERELAINPGTVFGHVEGLATRDPSFGLEAVWIEPGEREQTQTLGYTVVDAATVIATHLSQILQAHAHELLGHEEVQHLLDLLVKKSPKLVENLTPKPLPLGVILKVLQNLLAESIPIRDIRTIAESLAAQAGRSQDPDVLTAGVRSALGRTIIQHIYGSTEELPLITLDPGLEQMLQKTIQSGNGLALEPNLAQRLQQAVAAAAQQQEMAGEPPVLVVSPDLRPWLARWLRPQIRGLHVLAYTEISDNKRLRIVATVGRNDAAQPAG